MSIEFDDDELIKLGAKIVPGTGSKKPAPPKALSEMEQVIAEMRRIAEMLLARKPDVTNVKVEAPAVTVNAPEICLPGHPTTWVVDIERDRDDLIKRMIFTAK